MEKVISEVLKPYIEEEEIILDELYKFDEEKKTLTFEVDLIETTNKVSIKFLENGDVFAKCASKESVLKDKTPEECLREIMDEIVKERDERLEMTPSAFSPITPQVGGNHWDDQFDEEAEKIELDEEDEDSLLGAHCELGVKLFGIQSCNFIRGTTNCRITICGDTLENQVKVRYGITGLTKDVQLGLGPFGVGDYTLAEHPPALSGNFKDKAFKEQVLNIARIFTRKRWAELAEAAKKGTFPPPLEKNKMFEFVKDLVDEGCENSSLEYIRNRTRGEIIKKAIRRKEMQRAMAFCLLFAKFDHKKAVKEYTDLGGEISEPAMKSIENYEHKTKVRVNFITELLTFLNLKVPVCVEYCCICDTKIACSMDKTKPTICTNFACQFDYLALGICNSIPMEICPSSLAKDIVDNVNIVDMLITFCYAGVMSSRKNIIMKPFPPMFEKDGKKEYDALAKVLASLPPVEKMKKHCTSEHKLKYFLGGTMYELMKWILCHRRVAMVRLKKKIKEFDTDLQYMVLIDDTEKTKKFNKLRDEYGSFFAFHGSGLENWHSILRRGLLVGSGTDLQTTGAAYGTGIYMAQDTGTSMGYSHAYNTTAWPKSKFGTYNVKVITICEVVKHPKIPKTPSPFWVIKYPEYVTTRFLMFYPENQGQNSVYVDSIDLHKYIGVKKK